MTFRRKDLTHKIHEWTSGTDTFRLVGVAKFSPGYCDEIHLEKLGEDTLGDPKWNSVDSWNPTDGYKKSSLDILMTAINELKKVPR